MDLEENSFSKIEPDCEEQEQEIESLIIPRSFVKETIANEKKSKVSHKGQTVKVKGTVKIGPDSLRNEKFGSLSSDDRIGDLQADVDSCMDNSTDAKINTQKINNTWKYNKFDDSALDACERDDEQFHIRLLWFRDQSKWRHKKKQDCFYLSTPTNGWKPLNNFNVKKTSDIGYLECPDGTCTWIKWTQKKNGTLAAARTFEPNTMVGFFKGHQTSLENPSTLSDIQFLRPLEVWDQFCEADDQLFDEVLDLLKRTTSSDSFGLAYSIFRSYREHKMKIWIRPKQNSCGLCKFNMTFDKTKANARFDSYGYLITSKKVKKGEIFYVFNPNKAHLLQEKMLELKKRLDRTVQNEDAAFNDVFNDLAKEIDIVAFELAQVQDRNLKDKLLDDVEYESMATDFFMNESQSLPIHLEFKRLSNNLLYETYKIIDHNPNRVELLYFVDRYNWIANFEKLKNENECKIKFKIPSEMLIQRDPKTKCTWYELSKNTKTLEWTAVIKDNDKFKLIAKKEFRKGDLIGYFEGERKEGSGGIKELANSVVPSILKNQQKMMDLRRRIPPQTKLFVSGKTPAQHEYHKKNLYGISIDDLYQRTMGTGSKKVRERLSTIFSKHWIKYHINKTDGMVRFPVGVDGSGGKQGGVQFCADLDYDQKTSKYTKTLNNAEMLKDGFVVATKTIYVGAEIGFRFGKNHYDGSKSAVDTKKTTVAGSCNYKRDTQVEDLLKHLQDIQSN